MALRRASIPSTLAGLVTRIGRAPLRPLAVCLLVVGLFSQLAAACPIGSAAQAPGLGGLAAFPICHAQTSGDGKTVPHPGDPSAPHDAPCPFCSTGCHLALLPPPTEPDITTALAQAAGPKPLTIEISAAIAIGLAALPRGPPRA